MHEDVAGFIIAAQVMPDGQQDRDAAVPLVEALRKQYPIVKRVFFDRGFHSPANQQALAEILPDVCRPNSGDKVLAQQAAAASVSWTWQRRHHAGIEKGWPARMQRKTAQGFVIDPPPTSEIVHRLCPRQK